MDHPCDDRDTEEDPAVAAIVARYTNEWMKVRGVWEVSAGTIQTGSQQEIRVFVQPDQLAAAREHIPSEAEGTPVALIPRAMPVKEHFGVLLKSGAYPEDSAAAETRQKMAAAEALYSNVMREYAQQWNDLPGVIGMGPGKCGSQGCDFSRIKITVQAQFMSDIKEKIPNTIDGVAIVFVPYDGNAD